jgi:hypothetical protein
LFSIASALPCYFHVTGEDLPVHLACFGRVKTKWNYTMRPVHLFSRLSLTALAAASFTAVPAIANDIIFVPGTGEVAYAEDAATPIVTPLAGDYSADNYASNYVSNNDASIADTSDAEADMLAMAEKLEDPDMQDGVAFMAERMGETMMRLPIGKFASAIEKARPGSVRKRMRDDATLADLAGRDAEDIPEMLGKESRSAMKMMGGFTKAFAGMMPEFEKLSRDMEKTMANVKAKRR